MTTCRKRKDTGAHDLDGPYEGVYFCNVCGETVRPSETDFERTKRERARTKLDAEVRKRRAEAKYVLRPKRTPEEWANLAKSGAMELIDAKTQS